MVNIPKCVYPEAAFLSDMSYTYRNGIVEHAGHVSSAEM
jgi:hypothetical protein